MDKLSKTTFELKLMETNDDPDNFGLHVNDHFNVSDEHGNVVISTYSQRCEILSCIKHIDY